MQCSLKVLKSPSLQTGFEQVLAKPSVITQVTFSLQTSSHKLRALAADVLAAICVLSSSEGHKLVINAFSDSKVAYSEDARFEYLVKSIHVSDEQDTTQQGEEDEASLWEYRAAGMALISALANSPEDLEERMLLRDELARRGLNEAMTVSLTSDSELYFQLPDSCTDPSVYESTRCAGYPNSGVHGRKARRSRGIS